MWEVEAFLYLPGDLQTCIFVVVKEEHCKILFQEKEKLNISWEKFQRQGEKKKKKGKVFTYLVQ